MSMWRCPHCATPQAETARCWVCHRSSTTCSTCQHFRRSVAAQVGFCGLDRRHLPLTGLELRGCWSGAPAASAPPAPDQAMTSTRDEAWEGGRDFVPVELGGRRADAVPAKVPDLPPVPGRAAGSAADPGARARRHEVGDAPLEPEFVPADRWANRLTLFGDADR